MHLIQCMSRLFESAELRNQLKISSLNYARDCSWERIVDELILRYQEVLECQTSRSA